MVVWEAKGLKMLSSKPAWDIETLPKMVGGGNESLSYIKQRQAVAIRGSGTGGEMRDWGHKLLGQQNYLHCS